MADGAETLSPRVIPRDFTIMLQKLSLNVDISQKQLLGCTDITIVPQSANLKSVRLHARQCTICRITVNGRPAAYTQRDPYRHNEIFSNSSVFQHHLARQRLEPYLSSLQDEDDELSIQLPRGVQIKSLNPLSPAATEAGQPRPTSKVALDALTMPEATANATITENGLNFTPLQLIIEFELKNPRDGLQFVGLESGDSRYPHVFTQQLNTARPSACFFPCVDDLHIRCPWEISITCPQTLGDLGKKSVFENQTTLTRTSNRAYDPLRTVKHREDKLESFISGLSAAEKSIQFSIVCCGEMLEETDVPGDSTLKTARFSIMSSISASQIGFAVGPFEDVDLSDLREIDDDEKLGSNAIRIHGYCLPGRSEELKNTCLPMAKAIDYFTTAITPYPFDSYKVCFVDDLVLDTFSFAGLSMCSTRLLFPQNVIDNLYSVTRTLTHALAYQYAGISIIPYEPSDTWVVVGISYFIADLFLKQLCGNNEYRWRQKVAADRVIDLDYSRPSLYRLGPILHIDRSELEFLTLKSSVILFILDRRIMKSSGSAGLTRIISRLATNAKMGDMEQSTLSTAQFQKICEKMGHLKLDAFFQQWVFGAGCPQFSVSQKFNKKKLVIEMLITQVQAERASDSQRSNQELKPNVFMRDAKEEYNDIYAESLQSAFQGPMTIRIHEADGTPYEHIVEIKDTITKVEIPYNTKYKRLRRNRRQKDKSASTGNVDANHENPEDVLLYSLGDVLQSEDDYREWRLFDWTERDEKLMSEESYEWIRMDADFEWICKMQINMSPWMFISQLQQDRDVVAQLESLQYINTRQENPLVSTFLTRTLMDARYFHGIRATAASCLTKCATDELEWIGLFHLEKAFQDLYCFPGSNMPRSNDFSDQQAYLVQGAVVRAISKVKDISGKAPMRVKRFFLDKLKFSDNSANDFSDVFYIATLLHCLAETVIDKETDIHNGLKAGLTLEERLFNKEAIVEIERYRRIDEWILSYQNIFSSTALTCLTRLSQVGVADLDPRDILQYIRAGNADLLRINALDCLTQLGVQGHGGLLRYVIYIASTDSSPFIRRNFVRLLGHAFALIATGFTETEMEEPQQEAGLVLVSDDSGIEKRKAALSRKQTIPGALSTLRQELREDGALQAALWAAVNSRIAAPQEAYHLLSFCMMLYQPQDSLNLRLWYPRYWRATHFGGGVVQFTHSSRIRTTPIPSLKISSYNTTIAPMRPPKAQLLPQKQSSTLKLVPQPVAPQPSQQVNTPSPTPFNVSELQSYPGQVKKSNILKLSVGSRLASVPAVQKLQGAEVRGFGSGADEHSPGSPYLLDSAAQGPAYRKRKSSTPDQQQSNSFVKKRKQSSSAQSVTTNSANDEAAEGSKATSPTLERRPTLKLRLSLGGHASPQ